MKQITIAGNIGRDAEVRNVGDKRVTGWPVAVDDGWGDRKTTIWFDCSWWGQRGEKVAPYIRKGGKVTVTGELSKRDHDGKTYLTIDVTNVTLQSKAESDRQSSGGAGQQSNDGYDSGPANPSIDDEIPF